MLHDIRWSSKKIAKKLELIESLVYRSRLSLPPFRYIELENPIDQPTNSHDTSEKEWKEIPANTYWGGVDKNFILRTAFRIPADWPKDLHIALYLPIGIAGDFSHPEALVYIDDEPFAAVDRHHQEVILPESLTRDSSHNLTLHGWTGSLSQGKVQSLWMGESCLVVVDQATRDFISLARVALGIAVQLDRNDPIRAQLLTSLNQAINLLDTREPLGKDFYASVPDALHSLEEGVKLSGPAQEIQITAAGHAHIDIAWLWTLAQSRQKAHRTFHNVIRLMEQYPEFTFSQSQAQLYEFVRRDYPQLFEIIKDKINHGQWEPLGGMWVEADCNISGGEALIRQLLLGRNYFRQHFGKDAESPVLWLPDVFGFPWSLPQLIKEAGLESFFTIKLGWSQYNRLPFDSFWWQGLDGTRILTHFSTTKGSTDTFVSTYNATATPDEVLTTWKNFQQKDSGIPGQTPPLLMVYGYGDGGGGPTREMLENLQVMKHFPGTPQVQMGKVGEFFKNLRDSVGDRLPTWNDELYLEYHRGTYTTQARNKRANRKSEILLHNLEFTASLAKLLAPEYEYPYRDLRRLWELVCLNQFHDILPGTSIKDVYEESQAQYGELKQLGKNLMHEALEIISRYYVGDFLIVNPTSFSRSDLVFTQQEIPEGCLIEKKDGSPVDMQKVDGGHLLDVGEVSPYSITPIAIKKSTRTESASTSDHSELIAHNNHLENKHLCVTFDERGDISSIFNKELGQEILPPGAIANQFQAFEDRPITPDAWEIDISYDEKIWLADPVESMELIEHGPLRAAIKLKRTILNSTITQRISLDFNAKQLVFDTKVDWRERYILLKVAFPVQVLSPVATYEIQWGDIQRPTHHNTSWDWAKFEVPAHKWVDLSEGGYGVSLLNDCKYGHDIHDNVIRLTLLRSPSYPDPTADQGHHQFTYSLLPHGSDWKFNTISEAYALNDPLITYVHPQSSGFQTDMQGSFVQVDQRNVIIETIKAAEDGQGLIIRLFESQRKRCKCVLTTGFDISEGFRTNLLEDNLHSLETEGNRIKFDIKPYQIITFRLIPAA